MKSKKRNKQIERRIVLTRKKDETLVILTYIKNGREKERERDKNTQVLRKTKELKDRSKENAARKFIKM